MTELTACEIKRKSTSIKMLLIAILSISVILVYALVFVPFEFKALSAIIFVTAVITIFLILFKDVRNSCD